jgi:ribosomal protein S7
VTCLMFKGRNSGKKLLAVRIVKDTFEIIHLLTDANPLHVLAQAIINAGPREDSTRIGSAGVVRRQAVDVSPFRRVNQALYLISHGVRWGFSVLQCGEKKDLLVSGACLSGFPAVLSLTGCFYCWRECLCFIVGVVRMRCQAEMLLILCVSGLQAREASFRSLKTVAECLADEIVNASKGSSSSYAIKKKDEVERVAKANR